MSLNSLGDMAHGFMQSRTNTMIRSRLYTLSQELSTGQSADLGATLRGDLSRLAEYDRRLSLGDAETETARTVDQHLEVVQLSLNRIEASRQTLVEALTPLHADSGRIERELGVTQAMTSFATIVQTLNGRFGEQALFAGTASDGHALALAEDILTTLRAVIAGSTSKDQVLNALDVWFDQPGGGFETLAYLGNEGPKMSRRIDAATTITIDARADEPAFRELLKAVATVVLAEDPGIAITERDRSSMQVEANRALLSVGPLLTTLSSQTGVAQAAVGDAAASIAAERTVLSILRNEMVAADPFETATALEQVQIQLETHYSITARLARLNLAEYLR